MITEQDSAKNITITIEINSKKNRNNLIHTVKYEYQGEKVEKTRTNWDEAVSLAHIGIARIANGTGESKVLSGEVLFEYNRAIVNLGGTGMTLDEATKRLSDLQTKVTGRSLEGIIEKYLEMFPIIFPKIAFEAAITSWVEYLEEKGLKRESIKTNRSHTMRCARHIGGDLGDITEQKLNAFLLGSSPNSTTRNDYRSKVLNCLNWCVSAGLMSKMQIDLTKVDVYEVPIKKPKYYSAEELDRILSVLDPFEALVVVLMAFGALRWAEISRLSWEDFQWDVGYLDVPYEASKTGASRLIKIHKTLMPFLLPWQKCRGPVCIFPMEAMKERIKRKTLSLKIARLKNAFRHSFGTFHLADTDRDLGRTSEKMGNSIAMLKKFYDGRELNTKKVARYWDIRAHVENWTLPESYTDDFLRASATTCAAFLAVELADRGRSLPSKKTRFDERVAKIERIRAEAVDKMKEAPLPDFNLLAEWVRANPRQSRYIPNTPQEAGTETETETMAA